MKHFRKGDGERSGLFTRRALLLGGAQAVLLTALAGRLSRIQTAEMIIVARHPTAAAMKSSRKLAPQASASAASAGPMTTPRFMATRLML